MCPVKACREIPGDAPHLGRLVVSLDESISGLRLVVFHHAVRGHEHFPQSVNVARPALVGVGKKPGALIVEDGNALE
ncbi:hypothetical protein D3C81_1814010 [compost metagenome]